MTENTLDANICIQQLLQLVICFQRKQVSRPWLPGENSREKPSMSVGVWEVSVDALAVGFVRISSMCRNSSNGHFVYWHTDNWLEGLATARGQHRQLPLMHVRLTRTLSWEGLLRNVTKQLESLLLLAGTAKDCPLYGGKRKGSVEGICAVGRGM